VARVAALAVLLLMAPLLSGCLGQARTEWAFEATQLSELAKDGRTGKGVTVAILDTGIDVTHVALAHVADGDRDNGELVAFNDYIAGHNGVAKAYDDDGHGTHVAGIIAASGTSLGDQIEYGGISLLGGAPGALLVVAKVCGLDQDGKAYCNADAIPRAIDWAVAQDADVVNLSLGGGASADLFNRLCTATQATQNCAIRRSIEAAVDQGVVVVAAAGNMDAGACDEDVCAPGDIREVITVGAIQQDGTVWEHSSRGDDAGHPCTSTGVLAGPFSEPRCTPNQKPELVAPGVDILSAWPEGKYVSATGTSQATPFVTATVALLLEGRPDLRSEADVLRVKKAMVDTARPVAGQRLPHDDAAGYGLLQAKAAFDAYR
jgi:serine protease AprX